MATKTVVFIPDIPYALRRDLGLEGGPGPGSPPAAHGQAIRELGIEDDNDLARHIAGTVDGALIIKASALEGQVLVISLALFGVLRRAAPDGTRAAEPDLNLTEPADPLRPPAAYGATGSAPAGGSQPDLLQVLVTLSVPVDIEVDNATAARVIKME